MANDLLIDQKVLAYPLNLGADIVDDHGNPSQYMMFKIMDTERSTKLRDDTAKGPVYVTSNRGGVGIGVGTMAKDDVKSFINQKLDTELSTIEKSIDPTYSVKFDSKSVKEETWALQKGMVRLDKVVILPMPNEHNLSTNINYDANYRPTNLTKAGDIINSLGDGVASELWSMGKNAALATLANKLSGGLLGTNKEALLAEERLAQNPRKEVMFQDINFRQFSFRYQFAPKNATESETVNQIIETFRYYASPEISPAKYFYMFPAEFEVSFILGKKDNPNIPRMATSVLQRVGVNYAPNSGGWATLPNGAPVAIDMTLEFLEVQLIDRSMIYNKEHPIRSGH